MRSAQRGPQAAGRDSCEQGQGADAGKIRIAKLNVDENPRTAVSFRVQSIPTLLLFKNGQVVEQLIGSHPRESIKSVLDRHLAA